MITFFQRSSNSYSATVINNTDDAVNDFVNDLTLLVSLAENQQDPIIPPEFGMLL